jgi:calcineurin-like phosphoesterase
MSMTVLFVGDVVGPDAARWLAGRVPELRRDLGLDWVVVNAENCAVTGPSPMDGFGMTVELVECLVEAGVDVITGGNHSWDGPEVPQVLAHRRVVRPANVGAALGRGVLTVTGAAGALTVVNLLSPSAVLPGMRAPQPCALWPAWQELRRGGRLAGSVLVDLHGESAWEKASFAVAVDGEVAAVLGTHTHDPTLRTHVLPGGTAFVTEVGMTGRLGHTGGGFDPEHFAAALRGEDHTTLGPYQLSRGPFALGAVVFHTDPDHLNRATSIARVD